MTNNKNTLRKKESIAFGKKIYLLGADESGRRYWLEAPSWDCGWYWGFGYVETYTNNRYPGKSRDIESHQHIDSCFMGNIDGKYIYNIYDAPLLAATTFSEAEGWELSELFSQFYTLKKSAALFNGCSSNVAKTTVQHDKSKCTEMEKHINEVMIPAVTSRIIEILSK